MACIKSCNEEWGTICSRVYSQLDTMFRKGHQHWDANWRKQLDHFFEVRCIALPLAACDEGLLERLAIRPAANLWSRQWDVLAGLLDAARSVRHVPPYRPVLDENGCAPIKCSLLGSFEQMGPTNLDDSRMFWENLATSKAGLRGTRIQKRDRLCAVSLVKRFAWPAYFAGKLGLNVDELRFSDTATVAARHWLAAIPESQSPVLEPQELRDTEGAWNGQWLHWTSDNQGEKDGDPRRPEMVSQRLREKIARQGKPPTYYALLLMDGDDMGKLFRGESGDPAWGRGRGPIPSHHDTVDHLRPRKVSHIVEIDYDGELIYAGGDDVLALLPIRQVIACAGAIRLAYRSDECMGLSATISAGIAVVHIKEDLRFALHTLRGAERKAKALTGKNALALTVCRRLRRTRRRDPWLGPGRRLHADRQAFRGGGQ